MPVRSGSSGGSGTLKVLLWRKACVECHTLDFAGNRPAYEAAAPVPNVPEAAIPTRWMKHAFFDLHVSPDADLRGVYVTRARLLSEKASDVMIPGIDTCRKCHPFRIRRRGIRDGKLPECHLYHDRTKSKVVEGTLKISGVHP